MMHGKIIAAAAALLTASALGGVIGVSVDATRPGRVLPNTQSMLCMWHLPKNAFRSAKRNLECDVLEFAEFVEVMAATGGCWERDCFKNPGGRAVRDDYDFSRLVEGCKGIVGIGLKPYLKLGNVPRKMCSKAANGEYGVNVRPPDDYAEYGRYMSACANALLEAFGREELRKWRFAVLTEFENGDWFKDASGDGEKTFAAYCRLYETTVESFVNVIDPDLTIGVHTMAVTEGLWDERRFIKHAAERKLPLKFVTASFYDYKPGQPTDGKPLPQTIAHLREAAEAAGLHDLFYGVDEGRILCGRTRDKKSDPLALRIVGDTYQAAYDARTVKQLYDSGADYFASWGYLSGPSVFFEGLPSVSFHVARNTAKFKGMRRLQVAVEGCASGGIETDAVAALSQDGRTIRVMAYAFTNELFATGSVKLNLRMRLPEIWTNGGKVKAVFSVVDDNANWFDEWREEQKRLGIGGDRFMWSPDSPSPMSGSGLVSAEDRKMFKERLEPRFRKCAVLHEMTEMLNVGEDGTTSISREIPANAVLFVEAARADCDASVERCLPQGEAALRDGWEFSRDLKAWKGVRVPHDWAIAGPFNPKADGNTGKLPWKGVGWYRRTLELPKDAAGKFVALRFGGVMANPEVFLNGEKVGGWDYGYMSFEVDLSDKFRFGEKNTLLVKADTTRHFSRWYPGAGIYRDVMLVIEDARDRAVWGSVKITTPEVSTERAKVRVEYTMPQDRRPVVDEFEVKRPILWDVDNPYLYETTICGRTYRYGIRTFEFTPDDGFHLNGRRVQLKGVNLHSDLGPLGMAFDKGAMRRQLRIMKEMGVNALRTSHNVPASEVLDLCDEMGVVVWDECFDKWDETAGLAPSSPPEEPVMRNLKQMVRRDRNHPCVVCWSIGNEIKPQSKDYPSGANQERCRLFRDAILSEDASRPVGAGCCYTNSIERCDYAALDLTGWNYMERYMPMRRKDPCKPLVYSESASALSSWGFFPAAPSPNLVSYDDRTTVEIDAYDRCAASYADIPDMEFARMERDRFVAGEFVWTGIDYLGEPSPNPVLCRSSFYGICDLCAQPKDRYWLYRSFWNDRENTVHLLPHWNWKGREGENVTVFCYTNGDEAELFVNGVSAGRRKKNGMAGTVVGKDDPGYYKVTERYRLSWDVPYVPGEIRVLAFKCGSPIGEAFRKTADKAAAVRLTPEQTELADGELAFVKVEIEDAAGTVLPLAKDRVYFKLEGPGEIVAVGNGSHDGLDSFAETSSHPLYYGRALVIVRRTGCASLPIRLTASAPSVRSATVELSSLRTAGIR